LVKEISLEVVKKRQEERQGAVKKRETVRNWESMRERKKKLGSDPSTAGGVIGERGKAYFLRN